MTSTLPAGFAPFVLDSGQLRDAVLRYASNPLYIDGERWLNGDNPYRRQLLPQTLPSFDFSVPLRRDQVFSAAALASHRLLLNIYEADLVFLPGKGLEAKWSDFTAFYSSSNRAFGEIIRPALERHCFGFLDDEIDVTGDWTPASLEAYLTDIVRDDVGEWGGPERAILSSADPERAARSWMIQFAPDFLSEASPMIRNVLGNYGPAQSEWFKIVIDEYGYGVHESKHSSLFVDTLSSLGLDPGVHTYWQYYLAGSLAANNYFHYLGKNHENFFRYLGALYYTECTLVQFCARVIRMMRQVFGETADVRYFTEHVHIDVHHGRMALEKLVLPLVERCGDVVIPEIVRGVSEFRTLAGIADVDIAEQIRWTDGLDAAMREHDRLWPQIRDGELPAPATPLVGTSDTVITSDQYDTDTLLHVTSGSMRLIAGWEAELPLAPGDGVVIPAGRLHGATISSGDCTYETYPVPTEP
ncbi:MAG: iron-containing redox enzyme family protein [Mycobacteriales bacterium]|nr:MAG: cupin [Pseudonocardiales bacterium]